MAVYVDGLFDYGKRGKWCHMATDGDLPELHEMADRIGLKREWFQNHPTHPHYDLRASKRRLAIKEGAIPKSRQEVFKICFMK